MIELYHSNAAVCAIKVRLTLTEKKLKWTGHVLDLFNGDQFSPKYLKLNPKAVVPTLVHDGNVIVESTLICEYLDEVFPQPSLVPSTPYERAHMRMWGKMVDEKLHLGVASFSFSASFRNRLAELSAEKREQHFNKMTDLELRDIQISTFELGIESPYVMRAIVSYEKAFVTIDEVLASDQTWLMQEDYSLAEIYLTPYLFRLDSLDLLDIWLEHRPKVRSWYEQIKIRPSFKEAILDYIPEGYTDLMRAEGKKIKTQISKQYSEYFTNNVLIN
jgi:ganglioside-induced differentiation-associated protein 1